MKIRALLKVLFIVTLFFCVAPAVNHAFATGNVISSAAGDGGTMQTVLCNVLKFVTGGIGKTIAAFIIIGVGIGFFTGKVSWGVLIGVTLGISAMFGAPAIIGAITGDTTDFCNK